MHSLLMFERNLLQCALIPLIEFLHTVFNLDLVVPAEAVEFAYVDKLTWCAVGLGGIPNNLTFKAYGILYEIGQRFDGQFFACTNVDMAVANFTKRWDGTTTSL